MAYSTSTKTLERMKELLQPLKQGPCRWTAPTDGGSIRPAQHLAYKLREALHVAQLYPDQYPEFAELAHKYKIVIISPTEVEARPLLSVAKVSVTVGASQQAVQEASTSGPQSAESIIQLWTKLQPSEAILHFPEAKLKSAGLLRLHKWAQSMGWIFFESGGAITLKKPVDERETDLAWTPEDLEEV